MKWTTTGLLTLMTAFAGTPEAARAAPPVEVEVVVGDDDDDFFGEEAAEESEERSETKSSSSSGGGITNTQTQVVNIHINGQKVETDAEAESDVAATAPAEPEPEAEVEAESASAEAPAGEATVEAEEQHKGWWHDPEPHKGNVVLTLNGGTFKGFALEGYLSDVVALHIDAGFSGLDVNDDDNEATDVVEKGNFYLPQTQYGELNNGFTYMVDTGFRFHALPRKQWDLYFGLGPSWFGYSFDRLDALSEYGGSVLGRLDTGFRFHWNRLVTGVHFNWYPVEFARFQAQDDDDGGRSLQSADIQSEERYRADRYSVTWRVGLRF